MPGTLLASLQLGRVARSSQQMPAIGPFADALDARCDGLLLAECGRRRGAICSPKSAMVQRRLPTLGRSSWRRKADV